MEEVTSEDSLDTEFTHQMKTPVSWRREQKVRPKNGRVYKIKTCLFQTDVWVILEAEAHSLQVAAAAEF